MIWVGGGTHGSWQEVKVGEVARAEGWPAGFGMEAPVGAGRDRLGWAVTIRVKGGVRVTPVAIEVLYAAGVMGEALVGNVPQKGAGPVTGDDISNWSPDQET